MNRNIQVALKKYCCEVDKHLVCKKATKKRLLSALREELTDVAQGCSSYEEIAAQVGTPMETAKNLQETVSDQEYAEIVKQARRNRRVIIPVIVIVSLFLIAAALTYAYHIRSVKPVYYTTEIMEGSEGPPDVIWMD